MLLTGDTHVGLAAGLLIWGALVFVAFYLIRHGAIRLIEFRTKHRLLFPAFLVFFAFFVILYAAGAIK